MLLFVIGLGLAYLLLLSENLLALKYFLVLRIYDEGLISNSWALRGFYYREVVTVIENCLSFLLDS